MFLTYLALPISETFHFNITNIHGVYEHLEVLYIFVLLYDDPYLLE